MGILLLFQVFPGSSLWGAGLASTGRRIPYSTSEYLEVRGQNNFGDRRIVGQPSEGTDDEPMGEKLKPRFDGVHME